VSDYPVTRNARVSDSSSLSGVFAYMQNDVNIQKRFCMTKFDVITLLLGSPKDRDRFMPVNFRQ
jgi:hypothetical protein